MTKLFVILAMISATCFANQVLFGPPLVVNATATSAKVLNANSLRKYLLIVNKGDYAVEIKLGSSVQSGTEGIPIPAGGNYEPIQAPGNAVYAVTITGTSALTIIQGN